MKEYDVIVVGAGIAGLTAAIYSARAGKKVLVLESSAAGGQILDAKEVANYPGYLNIDGFTLSNNILEQAEALGAEVIYETAIKFELKGEVKKITATGGEYSAPKVILCMGIGSKPIGAEGEHELIGSGVSYCATCDGAFFKGRDTMVVGSSASAVNDAKYLSPIAGKVYVVSYDKEPKISGGNIQVITGAKVKQLIGNPLSSVKLENKDGSISTVKVSGIFAALGKAPKTDLIKDDIKLDEKGFIITDENMRTNINGVFAAGDIRSKSLRQLVTAAADGAVASKEALKN